MTKRSKWRLISRGVSLNSKTGCVFGSVAGSSPLSAGFACAGVAKLARKNSWRRCFSCSGVGRFGSLITLLYPSCASVSQEEACEEPITFLGNGTFGDQIRFDGPQTCRQLPVELEFVLCRMHFLAQGPGGLRVSHRGEVLLDFGDAIAVGSILCGHRLEFTDPAFRRRQFCREERSEDRAGVGRLSNRPVVEAEAEQTEGFEVFIRVQTRDRSRNRLV